MNDPQPTRASLLIRIRNQADREAWSQFVEIYAPLIYGFGRNRGLQDSDAADLTQDVLQSVAGAISRLNYDPRKGTFRSWLFTIVRNRLRNQLKAKARREQASGDSGVAARIEAEPYREDDWETTWQRDHQQRLFAWAARQVEAEVEPSTWQAFWKTTVDGISGRAVAEELGMTLASVYLAKSRVMAKLRTLVREGESDE